MKAAFLHAFDEYSDAIFRFCMVMTGNKELSEDLTQDTFMRYWQALRDGQEMTNTRSFLYTIARNRVIDWYRKHKDVSLDARMESGFVPADAHAGAGVGAEIAEILDAVQELDEADREVVTLRFVEGLDPKDIAAIRSESANSVSVRITRAVKRLQKKLGV